MAKTVITASTNDAANNFVLDGQELSKGNYEFITVIDEAVDNGSVVQKKLLGLKEKDSTINVVAPKLPTDWNNGTSDYATYDLAVAGIAPLIN